MSITALSELPKLVAPLNVVTTTTDKNRTEINRVRKLISDINGAGYLLPEKLIRCLYCLQTLDKNKRQMLKNQALGYLVSCRDFGNLSKEICDNLIDRLHDIQ